MQAVYNILTRIKNQLKADPNVNTVTFGDIFSIDLEKQTIYPLSHIILNNATLEGDTLNTWRFGVSVMCMDIVDISKESTTDIFRGNDNEQDILNTQHAVLARLLSVLANDDNLFTLDGEPTVEPFFDEYMNKLTGWTATFDILVPNDVPSCDADYVPNICLDATYAVLNSDGDEILSGSIASGESAEIELPDMTITVNYGGTATDFDIVTLGDNEINLIYT